jgi:hypothetical protein
MRRLGLVAAAAVLVALGAFSVNASGGKDQYGYNLTANNFNGTGNSWCLASGASQAACDLSLGDYKNDKLVMKWNEQWDICNDAGNLDPAACTGAWLNNEWNGKGKDGSGSVWKYKFVWIGPCGADGTPLPDGGYCIWGQYEAVMDQGQDPSYGPGHIWFAHATPGGYGAFK